MCQSMTRLTGAASPTNSEVSLTNDVVINVCALLITSCSLSMLSLERRFLRFCGVSPPSNTAPPLTIVCRSSMVSWLSRSLTLSTISGRSDRSPPDGAGAGEARPRVMRGRMKILKCISYGIQSHVLENWNWIDAGTLYTSCFYIAGPAFQTWLRVLFCLAVLILSIFTTAYF